MKKVKELVHSNHQIKIIGCIYTMNLLPTIHNLSCYRLSFEEYTCPTDLCGIPIPEDIQEKFKVIKFPIEYIKEKKEDLRVMTIPKIKEEINREGISENTFLTHVLYSKYMSSKNNIYNWCKELFNNEFINFKYVYEGRRQVKGFNDIATRRNEVIDLLEYHKTYSEEMFRDTETIQLFRIGTKNIRTIA